MSKVLERCKQILAVQRKSDNESIKQLVSAVARQLSVSVSDVQLEHAVIYLKYGKVVW